MSALGPGYLSAFYHWSPMENRDSIRVDGLIPGMPMTMSDGTDTLVQPHISIGPSPRAAWVLSGDTDWGGEKDDWDLWQVALADNDEVRLRTDYGPWITEAKVYNVIPADRLWWVGQRQPWLTFGAPPLVLRSI